MRKFFSSLGLITLICFSFFYTSKTVSVVKELDDIMIEIRGIEDSYRIEPEDAIIKENTIIPGISGNEIDVSKSYNRMKQIGKFNKNLLIFKNVKPKISVKDNIDKEVISGNQSLSQMSIVLIIDEDISKINEIVETNKVKVNYFITNDFYDNNNKIVNNLTKKHNFGFIDTCEAWVNNTLKKLGQKNCYCLNNSCLDCYKIKPSYSIKYSALKETKENLKNGSILLYKVNDNLKKEFDLVIKYIKSKGIKIVLLDELLEE